MSTKKVVKKKKVPKVIRVSETDPIGDLEPSFPHRDVMIKRDTDMKEFYTIEKEIGRGKFGTVYRCREKATGLKLAAKFVSIAKSEERRNAEREVELMRELQHPKLIQIYDAYEASKVLCVVLELIEGGELFERVIDDDFVLTEKAVTIFMRQICEGIEFIHSKNILHLDMKPENILCLTKSGNRIKIIDFGLARKYDPEKKLQVLFGTPEFVAPEVVGFDAIGKGTDMWSVGVICYVLLSGLSPFMGENDVQTLSNVTIAQYDFDDEAFDTISEDAKDFIRKLLLKDSTTRLSAEECLNHPWLEKKLPPPPPPLPDWGYEDVLDTTKEHLKDFVERWDAENNLIPFVQPNSTEGEPLTKRKKSETDDTSERSEHNERNEKDIGRNDEGETDTSPKIKPKGINAKPNKYLQMTDDSVPESTTIGKALTSLRKSSSKSSVSSSPSQSRRNSSRRPSEVSKLADKFTWIGNQIDKEIPPLDELESIKIMVVSNDKNDFSSCESGSSLSPVCSKNTSSLHSYNHHKSSRVDKKHDSIHSSDGACENDNISLKKSTKISKIDSKKTKNQSVSPKLKNKTIDPLEIRLKTENFERFSKNSDGKMQTRKPENEIKENLKSFKINLSNQNQLKENFFKEENDSTTKQAVEAIEENSSVNLNSKSAANCVEIDKLEDAKTKIIKKTTKKKKTKEGKTPISKKNKPELLQCQMKTVSSISDLVENRSNTSNTIVDGSQTVGNKSSICKKNKVEDSSNSVVDSNILAVDKSSTNKHDERNHTEATNMVVDKSSRSPKNNENHADTNNVVVDRCSSDCHKPSLNTKRRSEVKLEIIEESPLICTKKILMKNIIRGNPTNRESGPEFETDNSKTSSKMKIDSSEKRKTSADTKRDNAYKDWMSRRISDITSLLNKNNDYSNISTALASELQQISNDVKNTRISDVTNNNKNNPENPKSRPKFKVTFMNRDVPFGAPTSRNHVLNYLSKFTNSPSEINDPFHSEPSSSRTSPERISPPNITKGILSRFFADVLERRNSNVNSHLRHLHADAVSSL